MSHANKETRDLIKRAIKSGNVHYADDVGLISQPSGPVEIKSLQIWEPYSREEDGRIIGNNGGFEIEWRKPGCGFGGLTFVISLVWGPRMSVLRRWDPSSLRKFCRHLWILRSLRNRQISFVSLDNRSSFCYYAF